MGELPSVMGGCVWDGVCRGQTRRREDIRGIGGIVRGYCGYCAASHPRQNEPAASLDGTEDLSCWIYLNRVDSLSCTIGLGDEADEHWRRVLSGVAMAPDRE